VLRGFLRFPPDDVVYFRLAGGLGFLDPTNINVPKQLQITIDNKSMSNFEKNVNLMIVVNMG
jgi:hypothetical protein